MLRNGNFLGVCIRESAENALASSSPLFDLGA
jgi:hypothetical protein